MNAFKMTAVTADLAVVRNNRKEKWGAHFTAEPQGEDITKIIRHDEQRSGSGWRKYEYYFSNRSSLTHPNFFISSCAF
jgi:hypothetical protein